MRTAPETMADQRRQDAVDFLKLAAAGKAREAFPRYATPELRHHNVYFPGDADTLASAMDQNAAENPHKRLEILHTIAEGPLVAIHSKVRMKPDEAEYGLVHIFRFEGDRIAELWDLSMEVPKDSPNENGAF